MCGIVGLIGTQEAAQEAFLALTTLQHRGQDAAGILSYDDSGFHRVKNTGLVEAVFTRENMKNLTGQIAIGHARYSTIGRGDLIDVQPFLLSYPFGLGMVHNGNIVNCQQLAEDLKVRAKRRLLTQSDTEIVLNLFAEGLARWDINQAESSATAFERVCSSVAQIFQQVNGSYSILTLIADQGLVAFRDPHGIRPMVMGRKKNERGSWAYMIASESVCLPFLGYEWVRDIEPGEVLLIDFQGQIHSRVLDRKTSSHCMFEWVYFASPESVMDQIPVYKSRILLGKQLAAQIQKQMTETGMEVDLVVPVPETSRIAAIALAEELKIPYREVLIKNRYIKRTFILDSQEKRETAVNLKLSPVHSEIRGKRVLLVDDSIVRGTTSKKIIDLVRSAGASRVYFVSTCPPVQHPCYYGIDFPLESELIASGRSLHEIERELGADAVIYQSEQGLEQAMLQAAQEVAEKSKVGAPGGTPARPPRLCMACLNGQYPTNVSQPGSCFASHRREDRKESQ
ncbi:MAG: amidophosphoribosyltransferase [Bdellovibrionia bacterium]